LADHVDTLDHNSIYRYLKNEKLTPPLVWKKARQTIVQTTDGYILFDDTAADKSYSHDMAGVRRQYSGNAGGIVKGMGILACVYYNARADRFWVIDYRIFDPDRDGKSKLDHVSEMLDSIERRRILFGSVLMDSWYATTDLMAFRETTGQSLSEKNKVRLLPFSTRSGSTVVGSRSYY
jgi:hypothetical protein